MYMSKNNKFKKIKLKKNLHSTVRPYRNDNLFESEYDRKANIHKE